MDEAAVGMGIGVGDDIVSLYRLAVRDIYSYLMSRLGDRSTAEDLTQEVFMAAVARAGAGEMITVPWLKVAARNKLIDHWRARTREDHKLGRMHRATVLVQADSSPVDDVNAADGAMASLNATYRIALVLRHVDGLSVPEVADHLGRTVEATEQVLTRARVAFRQAYREAST